MVTLIKYGALSGGEKYNVNALSLDGLSTDTKPTRTYIEYGSDGREVGRMGIPNGSLYTEIDTGDKYMYDADNITWHKVSIGGGIVLVGETTTQLVDNATTNPITVDGQLYTAQPNDAVIYGNKEFLFDGTKWHEFGDLSGLSSKDIGAMTNYVKAQTGTAIATTDTLNQAIGKVEKRVEVNENNISLKANTSDVNTATANLEEKILDVKKLAVETETANKFTAQQSLTTGGYLAGGRVISNVQFGYTGYIEVEGGLEYIIGLVPAYGTASNPWMYCPVALEFYDSAKNYIGYVPKTTSSFKLPYNAKYIRVNACVGSGINTTILNSRAMLVKGNALPESYTANIPTVYVKDSVSALKTNVAFVNNQIHFVSDNLYNPSLQTSETISPHFYYNGVPYSTTELDNTYNCTALIEVEASTTYSIALVPSADGNSKPWWESGQGGFCYDSNGDYIASSMFTGNTFTTPANAKYIRFNYNLVHCPLNTLNERCVLVKGSTVPTKYEAYENCYIKEKIDEIENEIIPNPNLNYIIDQSGTGVTLIAKYSNEKDIAINLRKKGGNNLFDFYNFGLIPNTEKVVSKTLDNVTWFLTTASDWFAPFIVAAKNNIDGDDDTHTFTGGNHQYNNEGSGSTATARGIALRFLADNMEVTSGAGGCRRFEMIWTNLVQGWNTKKSDGTGREILQENHRLIFDGNKFEAFVDLIPLEDITMNKWYGFQWFFEPYPNTRFIGATNRMLNDSATAGAMSGDNKSNCVIGYGDDHEIKVSLDTTYDLGDRKYYTGNQGIFTLTYGKGYYSIIEGVDLDALAKYSLHGYYEFYARKEVEADTE